MQQLERPSESKVNSIKDARVLIVDDLVANVRLLEIILTRAGYSHICSSTDPRDTVGLVESFNPDILLLDLNMPHLDGFEVIKLLRSKLGNQLIPIIVLTADSDIKTKHRALQNGAKDFLTKPFDEVEVLLRMDNVLQSYFYSQLLEAKVRERTVDLHNAQMETLNRLALASDYRDDQTGLHAKRVGRTSGLIAQSLGLSEKFVELITDAAALHDVGKIGISDTILLKPGRLTPEEFAVIKNHTQIGAKILSGSSSPVLQLAEEIAFHHHEFWDGNGYAGMQGTDIPLSGRIVAIADFFDALTHERPYKEAWPVEVAVSEIVARRGTQFDPDVVDAFLRLDHQTLTH